MSDRVYGHGPLIVSQKLLARSADSDASPTSRTLRTVTAVTDPIAPTVCNLREAELIAPEFDSVISLVPSTARALRLHQNRCFVPFDDVGFATDGAAPTRRDIRKILRFVALPTDSLLVHCQYGQSRSTAVALGVYVSWGMAPDLAYRLLAAEHPPGRPFIPNVLVLSLFDQALGLDGTLIEAGSAWFDGA